MAGRAVVAAPIPPQLVRQVELEAKARTVALARTELRHSVAVVVTHRLAVTGPERRAATAGLARPAASPAARSRTRAAGAVVDKWSAALVAQAAVAEENCQVVLGLTMEPQILAVVVVVVTARPAQLVVAASSFFVIRPERFMRPAARLRLPARTRFIRLQPRVHLPLV
jgi:hypothetical protein